MIRALTSFLIAAKEWVPILLNAATLVVLWYTWKALLRQARAAEELTKATEAQIETSKVLAKAAEEQQRLGRRQLEESLRPFVIMRPGSGIVNDLRGSLVNQGAGPALDVAWSYRTLPLQSRESLESTIIAAGSEIGLRYDGSRGTREGMAFTYRSLTGTKHATQIEWRNGVMVASYLPNIE